mmetsp:Transcript_117419/g.228300  ORF Transcript_117419/g.228300 Transcript_117419/m.228300 type:complete len:497 (-) Transcript_117419:103-1593(-)
MAWDLRTRLCFVASFSIAVPIAAVAPSFGGHRGCFHEGQDYIDRPATDRPPNGGYAQAGPALCQLRCQRESWCNHFFWRQDGIPSRALLPNGCWLLNGDVLVVRGSILNASSAAGLLVHGPKVCPAGANQGENDGGTVASQPTNVQEGSTEGGNLAGSMLEQVENIGKFVRSHILKWWVLILVSILAFCTVILLCSCCGRSCTRPRQRIIEEELEFGEENESSMLVDEASTSEETSESLKATAASTAREQPPVGVKGLQPRQLFSQHFQPWAAASNFQQCMSNNGLSDNSAYVFQQPSVPLYSRAEPMETSRSHLSRLSTGTNGEASMPLNGSMSLRVPQLNQQQQQELGKVLVPQVQGQSGPRVLPGLPQSSPGHSGHVTPREQLTPGHSGPRVRPGLQSSTRGHSEPRLPSGPPTERRSSESRYLLSENRRSSRTEETPGHSTSTLPPNSPRYQPPTPYFKRKASPPKSGSVTPLSPNRVLSPDRVHQAPWVLG